MDWIAENLSVIVAIVGGLAGIYAAFSAKFARLETLITDLRRDVEKHNGVIERTYELEQRTAVHEQRIEASEARIKKLEGTA